jgi:NADP-dependent 3-hydroxy acid dehydrogenase YdfG
MAIVLVTGSSAGIGYAVAETLGRNNHKLYATMRNPQRSPQLHQLADKEKFHLTPMDVTDENSVNDAINSKINFITKFYLTIRVGFLHASEIYNNDRTNGTCQ